MLIEKKHLRYGVNCMISSYHKGYIRSSPSDITLKICLLATSSIKNKHICNDITKHRLILKSCYWSWQSISKQ